MSHNVQLHATGFSFTDREMVSIPRVGDHLEVFDTDTELTHEFQVAGVLWSADESFRTGETGALGAHIKLIKPAIRWDDLG